MPPKVHPSSTNQPDHNLPDQLLALELAWGLIANAYDAVGNSGMTDQQVREWTEAANRWRDEHWHAALDRHAGPKAFKVDPHAGHDKVIVIRGPGDLLLQVDYDDVDHYQVDRELPNLVDTLNAFWQAAPLRRVSLPGGYLELTTLLEQGYDDQPTVWQANLHGLDGRLIKQDVEYEEDADA